MFSLPVVLGVLLTAGAILGFFWLRKRAKRSPSQPGSQPEAGRIVWDLADGGRVPAIRNGKVSLDRRSFVSQIAASAMAIVGLTAVSAASTAAYGAHPASGAAGDHTDIAHNDTTGHHTDISCDPPTCSSSQHADGTPHNDRPHIDQTKE